MPTTATAHRLHCPYCRLTSEPFASRDEAAYYAALHDEMNHPDHPSATVLDH